MSIYESWLTGDRRLPTEPRFYFWTEPFDLESGSRDATRHVGDALVSLPVEIQRTPPGEQVYLPAPAIQYTAYVHPVWGNSTVFDNRNRKWQESTAAESYSGLKCSIPAQLAPVQLSKMMISIDLKTPDRRVTVSAERSDGSLQELAVLESPIGKKTITVDDPGLFGEDPQNVLTLLLHVGRLQTKTTSDELVPEFASAANSGWKIHSLEFAGWGTSR